PVSIAQGLRVPSVSVPTMTPALVAIITLPRFIPSRTPLSVAWLDQKPLPKRAVRSSAAATRSAAISAASAATASRIDSCTWLLRWAPGAPDVAPEPTIACAGGFANYIGHHCRKFSARRLLAARSVAMRPRRRYGRLKVGG